MNTDEILKELYSLDSSFQNHEKELKEIIEKLIAAKPETVLDENFIHQLREQVLSRAEIVKKNKIAPWTSLTGLARRLPYALGGAALILLIILFFASYFVLESKNSPPNQIAANKSSVSEVTQLPNNAFGSLAGLSKQETTSSINNGGPITSPAYLGQESAAASYQSSAAGMGGGGSVTGISGPAIIVAPPVAYTYVYKGGDFSVPAAEMLVYKGITNPVSLPFSQVVSKFNFSGINLNNFISAKVDTLTFSENRQFGYTVSLDFKTGTLSVYKNQNEWPKEPSVLCGDGGICNANDSGQSSLPEIPSDQEIINIADSFLRYYDIDMSGYGQGVIQNSGSIYPLGAGSSNATDAVIMPYMQPEISVIYPQVIDGKTVYSQSGNENGLTVGVDIFQKKVSYMYNLAYQNYQSSLYKTITDRNEIISAAENNSLDYNSQNNKKELFLGTPFLGMATTWKYASGTGSGYELYVPALIFPIQNPPSNFYQKNVVVPIIKDVFESIFNPTQPSPKPLPAAQQ